MLHALRLCFVDSVAAASVSACVKTPLHLAALAVPRVGLRAALAVTRPVCEWGSAPPALVAVRSWRVASPAGARTGTVAALVTPSWGASTCPSSQALRLPCARPLSRGMASSAQVRCQEAAVPTTPTRPSY